MLFIIILTLSLEVIAVVSINLRVYVFLYTQFTTRRRGHEQNISLTASCCCNEVKHVYQISRHGNKDVKENSRSPWNIYGFVLITNFVVKSFLRGFLRGGILNVVDRNRGVDRGAWERQVSYIRRFFQRMPELLLPLRVNSGWHSRRNFPRWGEAIWYDFR